MSRNPSISLFARGRRRNDDRLVKRLATADDAVLVLRDTEVRSASDSIRDLFGWEPTLCVGRSLSELFGRDTYRLLDDLQTSAEQAGGHLATHRGIGVENDEGNIVWVDVTIADRRDDPTIGGAIITLRNVSDRVETEQRIARAGHHDPVTETANAAMFDVLLQRALRDAAAVGLLLVGTEELETIANENGPELRDTVLVDISRRLASVLRSGDYLARIEAHTFAMLIHELEPTNPVVDLNEVKDRIGTIVSTPFVVNGVALRPTLSVRAVVSEPGESASELLDRATQLDRAAFR
jgi:PAS domain S-box-containing protein